MRVCPCVCVCVSVCVCVCVHVDSWLYKEATVRAAEPCPKDVEHLLVDVVITQAAYQRFRKLFSSRRPKADTH